MYVFVMLLNCKDVEKENISSEVKEVVKSTQHMAIQTSLHNVNNRACRIYGEWGFMGITLKFEWG